MILIDGKEYLAEQAIEVTRKNTVPVQRVERGFDVQDHVTASPLQLKLVLILFDKDGDYDRCHETSYEYLRSIHDKKSLVTVDCSDYAGKSCSGITTSMIYDDMVITHLGQVVQRGNVYLCTVLFTQVTKTAIATDTLYIQEVEKVVDPVTGNITTPTSVRWSKTPIEPSNINELTNVDETEPMPSCHALSPAGENVTSKSMIDDILNWGANMLEGVTTRLFG